MHGLIKGKLAGKNSYNCTGKVSVPRSIYISSIMGARLRDPHTKMSHTEGYLVYTFGWLVDFEELADRK